MPSFLSVIDLFLMRIGRAQRVLAEEIASLKNVKR